MKMRTAILRHVDDLPDWLSADRTDPVKPPVLPPSSKELLHATYENMFESFIEHIYRGKSLKQLVEEDARLLSYEDFMRWIKRDPIRHERYKEAQEMRTEFMAGEILEIADGLDSMDPSASETVNRDKLRIDTRKWLMSAHNRKRYGESKQIEMTGTISISEALAQAQGRVIDITPEQVEHVEQTEHYLDHQTDYYEDDQ